MFFSITSILITVPITGKTKRKILFELAKQNLHGYELAKRVDLSVTGIYQHLKELTQEGLIEPTRQDDKITYSLTEKGLFLVKVLKMK